MANESVKVYDVEIEQLAQIAEKWTEIDSVLERYVSILATIKDEAVKDGEISDVIFFLHKYSEKYSKYAKNLGKDVAKDARDFLARIEEIDLNLYNGS